MTYKKPIINAAFLLIIGGLNAQENTVASGGEATGSGGTISYSIGQVSYSNNQDANHSISEGVQQPYSISITTSLDEMTAHLSANVYPNPTNGLLGLKIESENFEKLDYQIFNMQGQIKDNKQISSTNTMIDMDKLPNGIYFLKIIENNKNVKTFKIIKK